MSEKLVLLGNPMCTFIRSVSHQLARVTSAAATDLLSNITASQAASADIQTVTGLQASATTTLVSFTSMDTRPTHTYVWIYL